MSLSPLVRSARRTACAALMVVCVSLLVASPALAQTSTVTQEDCDKGNITRNGKTLSKAECEKLIGQKVNTASTGFEVWMVGLVGVLCIGGAVVLIRRRRPDDAGAIA